MKCMKKFRKDKGYTASEMANILGISQSLYDKIEYDNRKPSREFMTKFKRCFPDFDMNIFFDELLHETCI